MTDMGGNTLSCKIPAVNTRVKQIEACFITAYNSRNIFLFQHCLYFCIDVVLVLGGLLFFCERRQCSENMRRQPSVHCTSHKQLNNQTHNHPHTHGSDTRPTSTFHGFRAAMYRSPWQVFKAKKTMRLFEQSNYMRTLHLVTIHSVASCTLSFKPQTSLYFCSNGLQWLGAAIGCRLARVSDTD